jgi:drug/metabolite transporter (DMT)-like permease
MALAAVYLVWGSTYLALRFALESFPPFSMGGARYTLAGVVLYAIMRRRGARAPTGGEWARAFLIGALLFAVGNGFVAVAEHTISSGVAAVVVATTSLWSVLFGAFWGERPTRMELAGLVLGLSGVALLQHGGAFAGSLTGLLAIVIAPIGWALGSALIARLAQPPGQMGAAVQMIAGGVTMALIGLVSGERIGVVTPRAVAAFVYLVVFGSFVAFSAYRFLLVSTRLALATSYAFVNPMVALVLGWALADEPLGIMHALACAVTVLGVLCVLRARAPRR